MAEERERKGSRRGRDESDAGIGASRQRSTEANETRRTRDDVRMSGSGREGDTERSSFYARAQQRRSRFAGGQGGYGEGGQAGYSGESNFGGPLRQGGYGGRSGYTGRGGQGGGRGYYGEGSRGGYGHERGQGGYRGGSGEERGGYGDRDFEERQLEYGSERGGRSERYYGGARAMRGDTERGYEGGHRETSMGGRSDYADYSNEPGWEPTYGGGYEQSREREGRQRGRWQREPLRAREIMTKDVRAARPESSVREVTEIMRDENTGIVPVVDEDRRLVGVITDRDIVMRSIPEGKDPSRLRASELMSDDVECATPDESVHDVIRMMGDKQVRRIPVIDNNDRLVGIISLADVATRADFDEELQDALEEISSRRSFWSKLFG